MQVGEPGPGEVRIRHRAVGLNFIDVYHRTGLYPLNMPASIGMEGAGVIEAVGERAGVRVRWRPMPAPLVLGAARSMEVAARLAPGRPEPMVTAYSVALLAYTQTLDISAARAELGWSPKVSFEEGLKRTIAG